LLKALDPPLLAFADNNTHHKWVMLIVLGPSLLGLREQNPTSMGPALTGPTLLGPSGAGPNFSESCYS